MLSILLLLLCGIAVGVALAYTIAFNSIVITPKRAKTWQKYTKTNNSFNSIVITQ